MISAIVLTKNEEKNIEPCLGSLSWCDELLVIDDKSTDNTIQIAKKKNVLVFSESLANDFGKQRNFALNKASGDWVLFVDADERVTPSLRDEIQAVLANRHNKFDGFYIKREDILFGKKLLHGEVGTIQLLRLAKKEGGHWKGIVHERWNIGGEIGFLHEPLLHYPHPTIADFLTTINHYTDLRAQELFTEGIHANWFSILAYPSGKFFVNYFVKRGFLDGIPGFIHATIMSFHSFLVRGKLWVLWHKS